MIKTTPQDQANAIRMEARAQNVWVTAHSSGIVIVSTTFTPGDMAAYAEAERSCNRVLNLVRQTRPGSVWGSTSDSVGGHVAIERGVCTINKSGVDKRIAKILSQ